MKRVFLHICCAPCSLYPVEVLRAQSYDVTGFFYNPNIHPSKEYILRRDTLLKYAKMDKLQLIIGDYKPEIYFYNVMDDIKNRCYHCYKMRIIETVRKAKELGYELFSTTLLYSIRQKHELIRSIGEEIGKIEGIKLLYYDFREGWKSGIEKSKKMGLYRQNYCGCIFSDKERFYKDEPQFL